MGKRLIYGVGINDADYVVKSILNGKAKYCRYYLTWKNMVRRCYDPKTLEKYPTYNGCYVCDEWLTFSNFKRWMKTQEWEGKQLDKDILFLGNKLYSPETCVFISRRVNIFLTECNSARGDLPIGVYYFKKNKNMINEHTKPYVAQIGDLAGKQTYLGMFSTPEGAHEAWLKAKLELAKELAAEILAEGGDPRVAKAIVERYENYKESP